MKLGVLDIGSDKICCLIAVIEKDNQPKIDGIGYRDSRGIKSGIITDMELAQTSITSAIQAAEKMSGVTLDEFIVNFSSNTIQSDLVNLTVSLDGNEISSQDLKNADKKAGEIPLGKDRILIHKILTSYTIDNQKGITNPISIKGDQLIAGYNLITASKNAVDNFVKCLSICRVKISNIVATPYAAGLGCLTNDDFFIGTTVIDIGAGNTSIATFADNKLIYTNVFELGGINISSDIAKGLSTPISEAERLKILYGSNLNPNEEENLINIPLTGEEGHAISHKVPKKVLNNIITSRIQEIFEIVKSKISKPILNKNFTNNIVLTGKTSQLHGCLDIASNIFGTTVRFGKPLGVKKLAENISGPGFSVSTGLLKFKMLEENLNKINTNLLLENSLIWKKLGTWVKESFF